MSYCYWTIYLFVCLLFRAMFGGNHNLWAGKLRGFWDTQDNEGRLSQESHSRKHIGIWPSCIELFVIVPSKWCTTVFNPQKPFLTHKWVYQLTSCHPASSPSKHLELQRASARKNCAKLVKVFCNASQNQKDRACWRNPSHQCDLDTSVWYQSSGAPWETDTIPEPGRECLDRLICPLITVQIELPKTVMYLQFVI